MNKFLLSETNAMNAREGTYYIALVNYSRKSNLFDRLMEMVDTGLINEFWYCTHFPEKEGEIAHVHYLLEIDEGRELPYKTISRYRPVWAEPDVWFNKVSEGEV